MSITSFLPTFGAFSRPPAGDAPSPTGLLGGHRARRALGTLALAACAFPGFAAGPDQIFVGAGLMHLREPPRFGYGSVEAVGFPGDGWIGAWAALDGAPRDNFLGCGPLVQMGLGRRFRLMVGTGPGFCSRNAADKLGYRYEYRSSAYLCWKGPKGHDLAVSVSHYSNGGMSKRNPGSEGVRLLYAFRLPHR